MLFKHKTISQTESTTSATKPETYDLFHFHIRIHKDTNEVIVTVDAPNEGDYIVEQIVGSDEKIRYTGMASSVGVSRKYEKEKYRDFLYYSKESVFERLFGIMIWERKEPFTYDELVALQDKLNDVYRDHHDELFDSIYKVSGKEQYPYTKLGAEEGEILLGKHTSLSKQVPPIDIDVLYIAPLDDRFSLLILPGGQTRITNGLSKVFADYPSTFIEGRDWCLNDHYSSYFNQGEHYIDARPLDGFTKEALEKIITRRESASDSQKQ